MEPQASSVRFRGGAPSGAPGRAPAHRAWQAWALAARVPTLTAAVTPVLVGTAAAAGASFRLAHALGALAVAVAIQVGTNFYNDALDFLRGADTPQRRGPARATQRGLLSPRQVLTGAYACFGLAGCVGAYFVWIFGWPVLVAGLLAIAAGIGYTGGPWPFGYHGLGELFVFVFFGVVAVVGSAYVQTGTIVPLAVAASVPVGMLCTAILVLNNLRDIETDRAAGKWTLAARVGPRATGAMYVGCLLVAAATPGVLRAAGLTGAWFWLPWLTAPLMGALASVALLHHDPSRLNRALRQTAALHLLFGMLLAASFLL